MAKSVSRRDFLKLSGMAMTSLAFAPLFPRPEEQDHGRLELASNDYAFTGYLPMSGVPLPID